MRSWTVQSASFHPAFTIEGRDLPSAIRLSLKRLIADALPNPVDWRPVLVAVTWETGICDGNGGVSITIKATHPSLDRPFDFYCFVEAPPSDLPSPMTLHLNPADFAVSSAS